MTFEIGADAIVEICVEKVRIWRLCIRKMTTNNQVGPESEFLNKDKDTNTDNTRDPINMNMYATKKTLAQGLLDVALLSANATQLKLVLSGGRSKQFVTIMVVLISISITLQVAVAVASLFLGGMININKASDQRKAVILNNVITGIVIVITAINIIISSLDVEFNTDAAPSPI